MERHTDYLSFQAGGKMTVPFEAFIIFSTNLRPDQLGDEAFLRRIQYKMFRHFEADLEGAVLFPGGALADVNGDAVRSFLVQARATFFM